MNTLKQLPELTALVEAGKNPFNQVLMNYVDQGGKTVGFMYQDTPEEIITAAGAAPFGGHGNGRSILPPAHLQLHETHL